MAHQFKPGDLALIIGYNTFSENVGQTCELVEFFGAGRDHLTPEGALSEAPSDCWLVEGKGILGAYQCRITGRITRTPRVAFVEPRHLMPLRGDFAPEPQKAKEAEPCA
ncbi:hypothetical protein [Pseudomonas syringae]|uniref:hypothetical protein n=1 Tax=Pseudomonas syringae TaxID=317 RepID=UPI000E316183|nr:hypothetical protein [Pseudomonas syringae]